MIKYLDEFRNKNLADGLIKNIKDIVSRPVTLMEVCGTHTVAIFKSGIRKLMPKEVSLVSGPGCPVCVTSDYDIDRAIGFAKEKDVILSTFGDMLRVPGSFSSLEKERSAGKDIRIVYSPLEAVEMAKENLQKKIVFLAAGFETTAPGVAASLGEAIRLGLKNYFLFSTHKIMPPAMEALIDKKEINLDGFICPGHVSTIIGAKAYHFIVKKYKIPCVISGFEPLDILQSIYMLLKQIKDKKPKVEIQYKRVVTERGNSKAQNMLKKVFKLSDSIWRGLGVIAKSGLKLKPEFADFDAEFNFKIKVNPAKTHQGCLCPEILRGIKTPPQCLYFGKNCTPENPIGPCMVSSEGTCAAYYNYS